MQLIVVLFLAVALNPPRGAGSSDFFETRIRPILANRCYACHTDSRLGELRLDSRQNILKGGKSGPAIVPGKPSESLLIQAVRHTHAYLKMPLGGKLKGHEIEDLARWVETGAPWPTADEARDTEGDKLVITPEQRRFWAFQPIRRPPLPKVCNAGWPRSAIDYFILARLEAEGLEPVKPADRRTLIRRATFDLIGLPPTPGEIESFVRDSSPEAFAKVVERLLASPHYGERWGRYWLDVARYADRDYRKKKGYQNSWRFRDWVIRGFNRDLPYDLFVKAQIAADLLPDGRDRDLLPGLGLFGLGPWSGGDCISFREARAAERDDRLDVITRGFLGFTVACARCHDHKYDPFTQKDYYALSGVFAGTDYHEYELAPESVVKEYEEHQSKIKTQEKAIEEFLKRESRELAEILAGQTSRYMMAVRQVLQSDPRPKTSEIAAREALDAETLERCLSYFTRPRWEHPYLKDWAALLARGGTEADAGRVAEAFQQTLTAVLAEKGALDQENQAARDNYKPREDAAMAHLPGGVIQYEDFCSDCDLIIKPIERDKFLLWLDFFKITDLTSFRPKEFAVFLYPGKEIERFLAPQWKRHLDSIRAKLEALEKASPPPYPYLMGIAESAKPVNLRINIRGNVDSLGDEVPRGFPAIWSGAAGPAPFHNGSGRLELAEAIVRHPQASRVMVNRIWMHHFGRGIVATPSNFGRVGERPSHPELLEYLAARFIDSNWSIKEMHREMMLSATYRLGPYSSEANSKVDAANRLLWRASRRRLDAEALRDSLLHVSGSLDPNSGGPPLPLDINNRKRTVYAEIVRSKPAGLLTLFDFPDPGLTSEQRSVTHVPVQGLFFLNSRLVMNEAEQLVARVDPRGSLEDATRIKKTYRLLYGREAEKLEVRLGLKFLQENHDESGATPSAWRQYAQVLLSSPEFYFVN